jgi:hypothetical protein
MNTQHCQTCSYWDQAHGLEMTSVGAIAPCTRHAPNLFTLESVEISEAAQHFSGYSAGDGLSAMQVPMALWPYTSRNQICGDYKPCDLEENARRSRLRAAPLI